MWHLNETMIRQLIFFRNFIECEKQKRRIKRKNKKKKKWEKWEKRKANVIDRTKRNETKPKATTTTTKKNDTFEQHAFV